MSYAWSTTSECICMLITIFYMNVELIVPDQLGCSHRLIVPPKRHGKQPFNCKGLAIHRSKMFVLFGTLWAVVRNNVMKRDYYWQILGVTSFLDHLRLAQTRRAELKLTTLISDT
eukprot:6182705-Pleurochrysis_carterae.AAC.2